MHKRFVANVVSRIIIVVCMVMLWPLGWAAYDQANSLESLAFIKTILIGLVVAFIILAAFPVKKKDRRPINAKDGLAIVGLSWIILSLWGALPLYFSGVVSSYTDAFFEITSGFSTTGASIFTDVEVLPRGILFWRSLTHWLGGMGIIVLYIALLPALGANAFQLYKAESPGLTVDRVEPRIKETAKKLWVIYFMLSALEVVFLMAGDMPLFDALCHTFGTVATGGFSTKNMSMGAYSPYIQWVIIGFMFLAGTNFILHYQMLRGRYRAIIHNEEFKLYCVLILVFTLSITLVLKTTAMSSAPLRDSAFHVLSILTTTGYVVVDFDAWPHVLRYVLLLMMFIGGCGGSTGGGMKVIRFFLSIKTAFRSVIHTLFPNIVMPIKMDGKPLSEQVVNAVMAYFIIYIFFFFTGGLLFIILEQCDVETALSAAIASLSNIGPGLNKVGAMQNYAWVSTPGKWLLTFLMLAGRLELYSILILLNPLTWRK